MKIHKTQEDEKLILALEGRLDTTTAQLLQDTLIPAFDEASQIELDFTALDYVSSAGLRVLLMGEKTAKAKNAVMKLKCVSPEIMEVFEMTGFTDVLSFV